MKKNKNIKIYTAAELETKRGESRSDLTRVDAITAAELEQLIAQDEDERDVQPDWARAKLVLPQAKQSVHLRLEPEVIAFFLSPRGKDIFPGCKRFLRLMWTRPGRKHKGRGHKHTAFVG